MLSFNYTSFHKVIKTYLIQIWEFDVGIELITELLLQTGLLFLCLKARQMIIKKYETLFSW